MFTIYANDASIKMSLLRMKDNLYIHKLPET